MQISNRVVLITGASEGIGAACVAEFARCGAKLVLNARSEERLRQVAADSGASDVLVVPGDLTEETVRAHLVRRAIERFGAVDILINNAGLGLYVPSWSAPMEDVRRLMELNFFVPLALIQLVAPGMRERGAGLIVNVGSIGGKVTLPWMTLYSASKFALGSVTEGLRMELMATGVRTMIVCPGYVKTGFQEHVIAGKAPLALIRRRRFAIEASKCAKDIRRGVERDARTVVTPRVGWLFAAVSRLLPAQVEARLARMNENA